VVNGSADCPRCGETVPLGNGGEGNFWLNHWMKTKCNNTYETRDKRNPLTKPKKQGNLFGFLKPKAPYVPPTAAAPTPLQDPSASPDPSVLVAANPVTTISSLKALQDLSILLPPAPISTPSSVFDVFGEPVAALEDAITQGDELWERLNPLIHGVFGYGMVIDEVAVKIKAVGRDGIGKFCEFVRYFVEERGVSYELFESKVELVKEGIRTMCVTSSIRAMT
jgi:hypothetical protein